MNNSRFNFKTRSLQIQLISESVSPRQLADRCGVDLRLIQNQFASNFPSQRVRFLIETALGIPIWSSVDEFKSAAGITHLFGFDPRVANFSRLKNFARKNGIEPHQKYRKPALIKRIARKISNAAHQVSTPHEKINV